MTRHERGQGRPEYRTRETSRTRETGKTGREKTNIRRHGRAEWDYCENAGREKTGEDMKLDETRLAWRGLT